MIVVHAGLGAFALWRRHLHPEHLKAQGREVMTVSPVSVTSNPQVLKD